MTNFTFLALAFGFKQFWLVFFGFFIGISWGAYLFVNHKYKRIMGHINKDFEKVPNDVKEKVSYYIYCMEKYHHKVRKNKIKIVFGLFTIKLKVDYKGLAKRYLNLDVEDNYIMPFEDEVKWLVTRIAEIKSPDSNYPLFELSYNEIIELCNKTLELCDNIIFELGIPSLDQMRISQIKDLSLLTSKALKIAKLKGVKITISLFNLIIKLQAIITPIFWIKKGTKMASTNSFQSFINKCIFEIVGKETMIIYNHN